MKTTEIADAVRELAGRPISIADVHHELMGCASLIEQLPTWPRPIPVGERLPETKDWVLAYMVEPTNRWHLAFYEDYRWFTGEWMPVAPIVTHWLPLPPGPADAKQ